MRFLTFDFETQGIESRPQYPPKPVGLAYQIEGEEPHYMSFGHTDSNNSTFDEAKEFLAKYWYDSDWALIAHNAKFDLDVAQVHFGLDLEKLDSNRIIDTMILLYLHNPHAATYALKPNTEKLLDMPPDEQDAVAEWLFNNQKTLGVKIGLGKGTKYPAGKYIALAPSELVGTYAKSDVDRTWKLYNYLNDKLGNDADVSRAYANEAKLLKFLLETEANGINIDIDKFNNDFLQYQKIAISVDTIIRRKFNFTSLEFIPYEEYKFLSGKDLKDALIKNNLIDESKLELTKKNQLSYSADSIKKAVSDIELTQLLEYRGFLLTCLNTFFNPWSVMIATDGKIYTQWHQTKDYHGFGTKTGRLSSTPNFQNIPNTFKVDDVLMKKYNLLPLPEMKRYIIAEEGCKLIDRDYSQQELRILAHYTGGRAEKYYNDNPNGDLHQFVVDVLAESGIQITRKQAKGINFGLVYGMGLAALAELIKVDMEKAKIISKTIREKLNIKDLSNKLVSRAKYNKPYYTYGGRRYFCEEAKIVEGVKRSFEYKMMNTLIQGSAADCTKLAVIYFFEGRKSKNWKLLATIHDEIVVSAPIDECEECNAFLEKCMSDVKFNVPLTSEGGIFNNLGESKDE